MKNLKNKYLNICQKLGAITKAPTELQGRSMLLLTGVGLLTLGVSDMAFAQTQAGYGNETSITIEASKINGIVVAIIQFLEGSFGALIMVIAGIGAIMSAAFGQYKAALGLLAVAIGAFILRSLVRTFFPGVLEQAGQ